MFEDEHCLEGARCVLGPFPSLRPFPFSLFLALPLYLSLFDTLSASHMDLVPLSPSTPTL